MSLEFNINGYGDLSTIFKKNYTGTYLSTNTYFINPSNKDLSQVFQPSINPGSAYSDQINYDTSYNTNYNSVKTDLRYLFQSINYLYINVSNYLATATYNGFTFYVFGTTSTSSDYTATLTINGNSTFNYIIVGGGGAGASGNSRYISCGGGGGGVSVGSFTTTTNITNVYTILSARGGNIVVPGTGYTGVTSYISLNGNYIASGSGGGTASGSSSAGSGGSGSSSGSYGGNGGNGSSGTGAGQTGKITPYYFNGSTIVTNPGNVYYGSGGGAVSSTNSSLAGAAGYYNSGGADGAVNSTTGGSAASYTGAGSGGGFVNGGGAGSGIVIIWY
jgi:hypothetical protein